MLSSVFSLTLILLLTLGTYFFIFYFELKNRYELRVTSLASTAAILMDGQAHDRLRTRADEDCAEYREIQKVLQNIQKVNPDITNIYTMRMIGEGEKWEFVVDVKTKAPSHIGDVYDATGQDAIKQAYAGAIADKRLMIGQWGAGLYGYAPIKNSNGQTVGIVGLHIAAENIFHQERKLALWELAIFVFSLGLTFYTTSKQVKSFPQPLEQMTAGVNRIRMGNYEHRIYIKTGDEFEILGDTLNAANDMMTNYQQMIERDLQNTRMQREKIFHVYRDVIYAVTQGKFNLLNEGEFELLKREGVFQEEVIIAAVTDVNAARELIAAYLEKRGCSQQHLAHIVLSISETVTNVIKHAGYGIMQIRALDHGVRVSVADQGPGMDFDKLPNMIFLQGFSTTVSMGYGFSIIYRFADKIYLSTSERGTSLAMDFLNLMDS
ncbi:ATP-binding protein [Desulfosporosinus burensis]